VRDHRAGLELKVAKRASVEREQLTAAAGNRAQVVHGKAIRRRRNYAEVRLPVV
jgi:hypothetical protein